MEPQKTERREGEEHLSASDILKPKYVGVSVNENGDLVYEKRHQSAMYKFLKYNPIDPLNDLYRALIDHWDFNEQEGRLQWWLAYFYVKLTMRVMWRYKVESVDGYLFPEYQQGIIISNHNSHLDPFFVGGCMHRRIRWMSKSENFKTPIVRTLFRNLGAFSLGERGNPLDLQRAVDEAKAILRGGEWVGIFPEGTRSKDGTLGEFKSGAVRLAIEEKVPIVPCAVLGSRDALPKGKLIGKPIQVKVRVGRPIYYDQYDGKATPELVERLTKELHQEVQNLIDGKHQYGRRKIKQPQTQSEALSIGSPQDVEKPKSRGIKGLIKDFGVGVLETIDDIWYGLLRGLEVFGVREQFQKMIWHFSSALVQILANNMAPFRAIGYENIPPTGAAVVVTNHNSEWDVIINAVAVERETKRVIYQMSKQSLFQIPIVNAWVRTHHAFPLKRGENDVQCFNYAKQLLDKGELVIVYPEGTTNTGGGVLLEGHTGAVRLAIEGKVPIIPVGITGTENIYPKNGKMLEFGKGSIFKCGPPFMDHAKYFDKPMPDYNELKRLTNKVMDHVADLTLYNTPDA